MSNWFNPYTRTVFGRILMVISIILIFFFIIQKRNGRRVLPLLS